MKKVEFENDVICCERCGQDVKIKNSYICYKPNGEDDADEVYYCVECYNIVACNIERENDEI